MSEFPSLAAFLAQHRFDDSMDEEIFCHESDGSPMVGMKRGPNPQADWQEWVDHIADAWREACTIRTVEQINALPRGTILLTLGENPVTKSHADGLWWMDQHDRPMPPRLMVGFRVLHHPDWARP